MRVPSSLSGLSGSPIWVVRSHFLIRTTVLDHRHQLGAITGVPAQLLIQLVQKPDPTQKEQGSNGNLEVAEDEPCKRKPLSSQAASTLCNSIAGHMSQYKCGNPERNDQRKETQDQTP
jgi:hypothetical protein